MHPLLPLIAEGVRLLLDLIRLARRDKDQKARLNRLLVAWEQAGRLKSLLILLWETEQVTEDNRLEAIAIGVQLNRLQPLLRDIRRGILDERPTAREFEAAEDLADELLKQLIRF